MGAMRLQPDDMPLALETTEDWARRGVTAWEIVAEVVSMGAGGGGGGGEDPPPPPDNPYEVDFGELALASDPRACRAAGVEPLTQVTQPAPPPSLPTTMMIIIPLSSFVRPRSPVSDPLNRGATLCARAPLCAAPPMAMCGLSRRRLRAAGAGPELRRDGASAARDLPLWWGCPSHPLFRSRFVTGAHLRLQCVSRALVTKIKGGHGQTRALHRWWRATWRRRRSAI
jgi:hypothetical protein